MSQSLLPCNGHRDTWGPGHPFDLNVSAWSPLDSGLARLETLWKWKPSKSFPNYRTTEVSQSRGLPPMSVSGLRQDKVQRQGPSGKTPGSLLPPQWGEKLIPRALQACICQGAGRQCYHYQANQPGG